MYRYCAHNLVIFIIARNNRNKIFNNGTQFISNYPKQPRWECVAHESPKIPKVQ